MESNISDPKVFGPGMWFVIHTMALEANDHDSKVAFVRMMMRLSNTLPCIECRKHFKDYIDKNSMERYWDKQDGLFLWTIIFHNSVNKRTGKPSIDVETAKVMYGPDGSHCNTCVRH
jgi:hypothetical protein